MTRESRASTQKVEIIWIKSMIEGLNWVEASTGVLLCKHGLPKGLDLQYNLALKPNPISNRLNSSIGLDLVICQDDAFEAVLTNMTVCGIIYWSVWLKPIVDSEKTMLLVGGRSGSGNSRMLNGVWDYSEATAASNPTGRAAINPKTRCLARFGL